jgi:hypothetical protein
MTTLAKYWIFLLLILFTLGELSAQDAILKGVVKDAQSEELLIGAALVLQDNSASSITDINGYFELRMPKLNQYQIIVSYLGYINDTLFLEALPLDKIKIALKPGLFLEEVLISEKNSKSKDNIQKTQMSAVDLSMDQINKLPALLSENDVLKSIQLLPGIQSSEGASTGYYVRGGSSDQNLILLNDATIYNPFHAAGFISIFNGDFIKDINVYKGSFPSNYGGRLSSLLNVETKEPSFTKVKGSAGIGLVTGKLTLELPIVKHKLALLVSGRAFYSYSLVRALVPDELKKDLPKYYFYDAYAQINWKPTAKDNISAFYYNGKDLVAFQDKTTTDSSTFNIPWSNTVAGMYWKRSFNDNTVGKLTVSFTAYDFMFAVGYSSGAQSLSTNIKDWGLKYNLSKAAKKHYLNYGAELNYKSISPKVTKDEASTRIADNREFYQPITATIFVNDDWNVTDRIGLNFGIRASYFNEKGKSYFAVDPKLVGKIIITDQNSIKFGYSYGSQFVHMLVNSTATTPLDLWVSSTDVIRPQTAHSVQLGYYQNFAKNQYEFSVESYYRKLGNQIEYKEGVDVFSNQPIESKLLFGEGWNTGMEFFLRKREGKFNGFVGYTLSWSKRQFDELNNGKAFNYKYDRRHDLSISLSYQFNEKWSISSLFVIGTGHSLTVPSDIYYTPKPNGASGFYIDYGDRNSYRLKPYHRLDLSFKYSGKPKRVQSHFKFDIYNVYNRKNTFFALLSTDTSRGVGYQAILKEYALIPIIPSISYQIEF